MKYLTIKPLKLALQLIHNDGNTQEHLTSRATSCLINNYPPFPKYINTPEQIQEISNKRPDYAIQTYDEAKNEFFYHTFVEVKGLINSNIEGILDQISDTIVYVVDHIEGNSVYAIAMKGTKIGIYIITMKHC
ncbi:MAG: hypothetical protein EOP34_02910 [Rickettsiales bacterium]|nr:MAG: hypothetical protein EOP34_02910 [Rickettsiales bacterium]